MTRRALSLAAAAVGLPLFAVTWEFAGGRTEQGTKDYLGLSEGEWRALLNVALVLLLLAIWPLRRSAGQPTRLGFQLAALGLVVMLVANLIEFGLWGRGINEEVGAAFLLPSFLFLFAGALLLAAGALRAWIRPGVSL